MTLGLRVRGKCKSREAERTDKKQTTDVNSLNLSSADGKKGDKFKRSFSGNTNEQSLCTKIILMA